MDRSDKAHSSKEKFIEKLLVWKMEVDENLIGINGTVIYTGYIDSGSGFLAPWRKIFKRIIFSILINQR